MDRHWWTGTGESAELVALPLAMQTEQPTSRIHTLQFYWVNRWPNHSVGKPTAAVNWPAKLITSMADYSTDYTLQALDGFPSCSFMLATMAPPAAHLNRTLCYTLFASALSKSALCLKEIKKSNSHLGSALPGVRMAILIELPHCVSEGSHMWLALRFPERNLSHFGI